MIRAKIFGGLGNQLFQYAYAFYLSERFNDEILLYPDESRTIYRKFKLKDLNVKYKKILHKNPFIVSLYENKIANKLLRISGTKQLKYGYKKTYLLQKKCSDSPILFNDKETVNDVFIHGYWFSLEMPMEIEKKLIKMITPTFNLSNNYQILKEEIKACNSVSIHIRRGDYIKYLPKNILKNEYYYHAQKLLENKYANLKFFFFSDDIDYVKSNFSDFENAKYVHLDGNNSDIEELLLMSNCKFNIICDSTFSVWAGRLNQNADKKIIAPEGCIKYKFPMQDWIMLKNAYINDAEEIDVLKHL